MKTENVFGKDVIYNLIINELPWYGSHDNTKQITSFNQINYLQDVDLSQSFVLMNLFLEREISYFSSNIWVLHNYLVLRLSNLEQWQIIWPNVYILSSLSLVGRFFDLIYSL